MTFERHAEHAQCIRQLQLKLEIADNGMGMPYDAERVRDLRKAINDAIDAYTTECLQVAS